MSNWFAHLSEDLKRLEVIINVSYSIDFLSSWQLKSEKQLDVYSEIIMPPFWKCRFSVILVKKGEKQLAWVRLSWMTNMVWAWEMIKTLLIGLNQHLVDGIKKSHDFNFSVRFETWKEDKNCRNVTIN